METNVLATLSPLAGYTDIAFREICSKMGASEVVTEMVSCKGIVYEDRKTNDLLLISPNEKNVVVQLFGEDPYYMAKAAEIVSKMNFVGIDINMGCPAPKIVKNNSGSALLDQPDLVYKITKEVVGATDLPVSVKIRKGIRDNSSIEAAKAIEAAGASRITVHGRTREEYYTGFSDWDYIAEVAKLLDIPVFGNGDIDSYDTAFKRINDCNLKGVSIGRAAIGNPFIFEEISKKSKGEDYFEPSFADRIEKAREHLKLAVEYKNERLGILEMRKQFVGYFKGMPGSKEARDKINRLNSYESVDEELIRFKEKFI
ncbi:tRNA dihydrouridine synthase DusB [Peptoniphilus asaccharolyticus]